MFKRVWLFLILTLLIANAADAAKIYWRSSLTGGSSGALDAISSIAATPGVPLASGDAAIIVGSSSYWYTYDAANNSSESSPAIIVPDDAGATGRWLRVPAFLLAADIGDLANVAATGSYTDLLNKPSIPTAVSQLTNDSGYSIFDPAAPGEIGVTTPSLGFFTSATAQQLTLGPQPIGTTGELSLPEDPANPGDNTVGWKAPSDIPATIKWVMPAIDGTAGQVFKTDGATHTYFDDESDPTVNTSIEIVTIINTTPTTLISAATIDSAIARDSELNPFIPANPGPIGANDPDIIYATELITDSITTNTGPTGTTDTISLREDSASPGGHKFIFKADTSIEADTTVLVPSQLPSYSDTCPTTATDSCNAGQQCLSTTYHYTCVAANTWRRVSISGW